MRAIPDFQLTEKTGEKRLATVKEIRWQQDRSRRQARLFLQQLTDAEAKARAQIAARDALITDLQQRLAALEHEPRLLRLRNQVEEYAAKLVGERVRAECAEASAAQWKRSAMKNGERYLRLQGRLAQARSACTALEARLGRLVSPVFGAFTKHDAVVASSAGGRPSPEIVSGSDFCRRASQATGAQQGGNPENEPYGTAAVAGHCNRIRCGCGR